MNKSGLSTFVMLPLLLCLLFQSCQSSAIVTQGYSEQGKTDADDLCKRLAEIKKIPFKGEIVDDEVYNMVMGQGKAAIPCLIDKITDTTKMKDPRSAPTYRDFRVGDLAFFLLVRITKTPFEEMLSEPVKDQLKDEGVYAYFRYVEDTDNRKNLQEKWREWFKKQGG